MSAELVRRAAVARYTDSPRVIAGRRDVLDTPWRSRAGFHVLATPRVPAVTVDSETTERAAELVRRAAVARYTDSPRVIAGRIEVIEDYLWDDARGVRSAH